MSRAARIVSNILSLPKKPAPGIWGPLAAPVDPTETDIRARAQSILSGPLIGACPTLTLDQAQDVLRWNREPTK